MAITLETQVTELLNQIAMARNELDSPFLEKNEKEEKISEIKANAETLIAFLQPLELSNSARVVRVLQDIISRKEDTIRIAIDNLMLQRQRLLSEISRQPKEQAPGQPEEQVLEQPKEPALEQSQEPVFAQPAGRVFVRPKDQALEQPGKQALEQLKQQVFAPPKKPIIKQQLDPAIVRMQATDLLNKIDTAAKKLENPFMADDKRALKIKEIKANAATLIELLTPLNQPNSNQAVMVLQDIKNGNENAIQIAVSNLIFPKQRLLNEISPVSAIQPKQQAPAQPKQQVPAQPKQQAPAQPKQQAPAQPKQQAPAQPKQPAPAAAEATKSSPIYNTVFALNDTGQRSYMTVGAALAAFGLLLLLTPAAPVAALAVSPFVVMVGVGMVIFGGLSKFLNSKPEAKPEASEIVKPVNHVNPAKKAKSGHDNKPDIDPVLPNAYASVIQKPNDKSKQQPVPQQHQPKGPQ